MPAQRRRVPRSLAESPAAYGRDVRSESDTETVVPIRERAGGYVAIVPGTGEEVRSASLDGIARDVQQRIAELAASGKVPAALLCLRIAVEPVGCDPIVAKFEEGIDRTLIRRNLRRTPEERLTNLQAWIDSADEVRGIAWESSRDSDE